MQLRLDMHSHETNTLTINDRLKTRFFYFSARKSAILPLVFRSYPQSLKVNASIVP
jgi:hypothetical protein